MASPHPKPAEVKKLMGTDRADRVNADRMQPSKVSIVPKAPEYLGKHGKQLWKEQLQQLAILKMLTKVDLIALGQYCKEWDIYRIALDEIDKKGLRNEYDQISPAVSVKNQAFKNMLQIADRFGFVASARERLTMPEDKSEDPLEKHMAKIHSMDKPSQKDLKSWAATKKINKRIVKALVDAGVESFEDLKSFTKKELLKIKGIGPASVKTLQKTLK